MCLWTVLLLPFYSFIARAFHRMISATKLCSVSARTKLDRSPVLTVELDTGTHIKPRRPNFELRESTVFETFIKYVLSFYELPNETGDGRFLKFISKNHSTLAAKCRQSAS